MYQWFSTDLKPDSGFDFLINFETVSSQKQKTWFGDNIFFILKFLKHFKTKNIFYYKLNLNFMNRYQ